jgi:3'-phosphoadenosine 5'-phosphosulfate sulfotransferase (PAPS reductase)/FAD synthetase
MPIAFWTENDILEYIYTKNLKIASVYGDIIKMEDGTYTTTGCDRTGCMFCMFGCHLEKEPNRFQKLSQTHPKIYDYCMKPTDEGGLGIAEVLDFIGVPYKNNKKEF